jgi:hypothetical protein
VPFYVEEEIYPAVAMRKYHQSVRVNFSDREFYYDIKNYKNKVFDEILKEVRLVNGFTTFGSDIELILEYLNNYGYQDTLCELLNENNSGYVDSLSEQRRKLSMLLREFKFVDAIGLIKNYFPNSTDAVTFLEICEMLQKAAEEFSISRDNVKTIIFLRQRFENYQVFIKTCKCVEDFILTYMGILADLIQSSNILNLISILNADIIIDYINANIQAENNFSNNTNNKFEILYRQVLTVLNVNNL